MFREFIKEIKNIFNSLQIEPQEINDLLQRLENSPIIEKQRLDKLILRPDVHVDLFKQIPRIAETITSFSKEELEQAEIQIKYQVYIDKENELVNRMKQMEDLAIPEQFDYKKIQALGAEAREKLIRIKPRTLGQASRISGINPSDVQILMVYMGR